MGMIMRKFIFAAILVTIILGAGASFVEAAPGGKQSKMGQSRGELILNTPAPYTVGQIVSFTVETRLEKWIVTVKCLQVGNPNYVYWQSLGYQETPDRQPAFTLNWEGGGPAECTAELRALDKSGNWGLRDTVTIQVEG